ncbi:hypothetical protein [Muribaculum intestinale]|uniref:hypothetical protein n=1 Tax=Muribaculum intestinale TaxID=1796646 RepID=UPI00272C18B2|nr:hypothetical protein [Muribaculum intestinale]
MQFTVKIKKEVIEAVQKCAADIKQLLSNAEGQQDEKTATVGLLKDRARDLRYEADLLEGVANTYAEGVSDMLLDKRIEDYAAYKAQQIMRDHEPAYNVH